MSNLFALRRDDSLALADGTPPRLSKAISARVDGWPHGIVRTYDVTGLRRSVTYAEAWARSSRIAAAIINSGHPPDQPVVIAVEDATDFVATHWACIRAGRTVVSLQSAVEAAAQPLGYVTLEAIFKKLVRPLILVDEYYAQNTAIERFSESHPVIKLSSANDVKTEFDDAAVQTEPACLVATSGSTGSIKLAKLTEHTLLYRYFSKDRPGPRAGTNNLGFFPLDSMSGLRLSFLVCDTFTQLTKRVLTSKPQAILHAMDELKISGISLTNTMAKQLLDVEQLVPASLDFSSLRSCGLGGETIVRDVAVELDAMLSRHGASGKLYAGYGATEIGDIVAAANPLSGPTHADRGVRLGACAPGVSMRIVDDTGALLREGQVGAVQVKAPLKVFDGYWGDAKLSDSSFTADGWWRSGDLGELNDGIFTFRGRSKEIIVINGRKISLSEIDTCLHENINVEARCYSCAIRTEDDVTERLGIVFEGGGIDESATAESIQVATLSAFGILPDPVLPMARAEIPRTMTGKVRRGELASLLQSEKLRHVSDEQGISDVEISNQALHVLLEEIWRLALNFQGNLDRDQSFFELGGDSLRSAALHALISRKFGRRLQMDRFFKEPTYNQLVRLLTDRDPHAKIEESRSDDFASWPLPAFFREQQLALLETWPGERVTTDRLVLASNTRGAHPPLFSVVNDILEATALPEYLGSEQPVYIFRSNRAVCDYAEDKVQAIALNYVKSIEKLCPAGPLNILGQCQGGTIAIAIAQHLLRRGRHIPLLVLAEWTFEAIHYPGRVLLVYGADSKQNPKYLFKDPSYAWRRFISQHEFLEVPGSYALLYTDENMPFFASQLNVRLKKALTLPTKLASLESIGALIEPINVPRSVHTGQSCSIEVSIKNTGSVAICSGINGLMVGSYWVRDDDTMTYRVDGRGWIVNLLPGDRDVVTLCARAPDRPGRYRLCIDLVEEGYRWLTPLGQAGHEVEVVPGLGTV